jgi:hypothetical protein
VRAADREQHHGHKKNAQNGGDIEQTFHALSLFFGLFLSSAAFKFQDVDKHSQQNVEDVIQRFYRGDGAAASLARAHAAGHFLELEALALQNHQRLDFRIFQRKTAGENLQMLGGSRRRIPK